MLWHKWPCKSQKSLNVGIWCSSPSSNSQSCFGSSFLICRMGLIILSELTSQALSTENKGNFKITIKPVTDVEGSHYHGEGGSPEIQREEDFLSP